MKEKYGTKEENTWCPGCPNHMIEEAVKQTIQKFVDRGTYKQTDFAITTDIGCHGKMFDYLNVSGFYALHGRALPVAMGMKMGNPNLKVITFAGDGAVYSEGIAHFAHLFKYNPDMTLILHDNQSFSLTTGQPTPTSQQGWKTPSEPLGVFDKPLNPLKLALAMNASFIARTNARDIPHMVEVFTKAVNHKGFSFVEVIQDCIIFNKEINNKDKGMYKVRDNYDYKTAEAYVAEYDYNSRNGKIPIGVLYKTNEPSFEEKWPQLRILLKKKVGWNKKPKFV